MAIQIPDEFVPVESGGFVTQAKYIKSGDKTQEEINEEKINEVPQTDGMYVRKNGKWIPIDIHYDSENEALVINIDDNTNI